MQNIMLHNLNPEFIYLEDDSVQPDFICPTCGMEWWHDREENRWDAVSMASVDHPMVGNCCVNCALGEATVQQLDKATSGYDLYGDVLKEAMRLQDCDGIAARIVRLIRDHDPDLFVDAAREVFCLGANEDKLWEVMRNA